MLSHVCTQKHITKSPTELNSPCVSYLDSFFLANNIHLFVRKTTYTTKVDGSWIMNYVLFMFEIILFNIFSRKGF